MRINVYNEELSDRVEVDSKTANTVVFRAIRFYVGETNEHTPGDDDSSGVTFWFSDEYGRGLLRSAFTKALNLLDGPETQL
jgi:hypothetical protein